ncbi:hypothetical protein [Streptomyces sp. SP18CS02]|uniref:hypothetical protein n=1 Tax=Streptomyces sp. SP18CS02 TaxID=3002531 RepID=UPI002E77278D|nr:hypothetical protein [Streptomyces sp. SP18CS02]MEE1753004.1 hypothetical protein [Streptomyces sp. SP18CS02]
MILVTAGTEFPDDLRAAQTRLHQATAELAALCRSLPWSVEPLPGWPGTEHPHTGEMTGGRDASPGWTEEQKTAVQRLRTECVDLSARVATHPFWATVEAGTRMQTRMELKQATAPTATPVLDVAEAA